jgi:hypothetical protein
MLFQGTWELSDSGIPYPQLLAKILNLDGEEDLFPFLVDTGAEVTVFNSTVFEFLKLDTDDLQESLVEGVGGGEKVVQFPTEILLERETGVWISFQGNFRAFPDPNDLETSILGRDVLNHFAVIVDRPGEAVNLLHGNHRYAVLES